MKATMLLKNARVYTMEDEPELTGKRYRAVAISNNKIMKVGDEEELTELCGAETEVYDLEGCTVLPGFNDSHIHLVGYGISRDSIELSRVRSIPELIEICRNFIARRGKKPGEWFLGRGWDQNLFKQEKRFPNRFDLDKISTTHPILLLRTCGHIGSVNTKALEEVGVTDRIKIKGGQIDKDKTGNPNGIIREAALEWFKINRKNKPGISDLKGIIRRTAQDLLKYGITSIQSEDSYDLGYDGPFFHIYQAYQSLVQEEKLPVRVYQKISLPDIDSLTSFLNNGYRTGEGNDFYKIGPLKLWLDGTLGARTAALLDDYQDDQGNRGILVYKTEELYRMVLLAHQEGMQVCLHAIGDAALAQALEVYERVLNEEPRKHRHRIIHCQIGNRSLYEKIVRLGLVVNIQPAFVASDWAMVRPRLGKKREKESYSWKQLLDLGISISGGSDCPVESPNPLAGIYAAVTRKDLTGAPPGGWLPEQKVSREAAVAMYTKGSSYAAFEEGSKGTLSEGKLADIAVLDHDPFTIAADKIKDIRVMMTIVNGKVRYQSSDF